MNKHLKKIVSLLLSAVISISTAISAIATTAAANNAVSLSEICNYRITVKTSNSKNAGTDGDVSLYATYNHGITCKQFRLADSRDNFESNQEDVFYITTTSEIENIQIQLESGYDDDWHLSYVLVELLLGNTVKETVLYNFNHWIIADNPNKADPISRVELEPSKSYKVSVKTSSKTFAGTDNDVYLQAYDKDGLLIKEVFLDNDENNFEEGRIDTFYFSIRGEIASIKMRCGSNAGTKWHLEYVQLEDISYKTPYKFTQYKFNQWIEGGSTHAPKN